MSKVYRPQRFSEFNGQTRAKGNLLIAVDSACRRGKPVPHVLLSGPPGLGKTTLAGVVAAERGVTATVLNATAIEKPADLVVPLLQCEENGIVFIDEIHALKPLCEEFLYTAMEDRKITIPTGDGKEPLTTTVNPFTLIGATTREGLLSGPLRDRFQLREKLDVYTDEEMENIVEWTMQQYKEDEGFTFHGVTPVRVVPCCHGVARAVQRILMAIRDEAVVDAEAGSMRDKAESKHINQALKRLGYYLEVPSPAGFLQHEEVRYLQALNAHRKPVGLKHLAKVLNEDERTIEDVIEPWLLRHQMAIRSPGGRLIAYEGERYLKMWELKCR